jgi:hypothetical protein
VMVEVVVRGGAEEYVWGKEEDILPLHQQG